MASRWAAVFAAVDNRHILADLVLLMELGSMRVDPNAVSVGKTRAIVDTAGSCGHVPECRFSHLRTAYQRKELTGVLDRPSPGSSIVGYSEIMIAMRRGTEDVGK